MGGSSQFHQSFDELFLNLTGTTFGAGAMDKTFFSFAPQRNKTTEKQTYDWQDGALNGLRAVFDERWQWMLDTVDLAGDPNAPCRFYVGFPIVRGYANRTMECGLYNSSYDIELSFENGKQATQIRNITKLNPVSTAYATNQQIYMIHGAVDAAYIAVMDALGALLSGWIQSTRFSVMLPQRTQVLSTVLTEAYEMQHLEHSALRGNPTGGDSSATSQLTMAQTLELLVANISVSLFSIKDFV
jgi:hypothetical protein